MNFNIKKNKLLNIFVIFWIFLFCVLHMNMKNNQVFAIKFIHPNSISKIETIRKIIVLKWAPKMPKFRAI
ncbi:hypothetical protein OC686_02260 ['Opuntia sp.' phytoplasma]|uniref:Secreted protein n=1 Tax=Candidatus Phytoplasma asiaticum TaxID=2763338 RepID=A0AAX3B8I1_9MOLU|nr:MULTISPECIES: hypothetical protein [Phytoplasma]MDO8058071.1 hypothetical protein ['Opuntia sp.' phytoplasma]UQV27006.1 hypothetical protein H7686_0001385 ['Parthenium hysterophorus' phyllody phytoplasma]